METSLFVILTVTSARREDHERLTKREILVKRLMIPSKVHSGLSPPILKPPFQFHLPPMAAGLAVC